MKQFTADEPNAAVASDPACAATITEPVESTNYCDMDGSKNTHLSPMFHFGTRDHS